MNDDLLNSIIDDKNIEYVTVYAQEMCSSLGMVGNVTYRKNDDGSYNIYNNNTLLVENIKPDVSVKSAIKDVVSGINSNISNNSNKITNRALTRNVPTIYLVLKDINNSLIYYEKMGKELDKVKDYNIDNITGELASYYKTLDDDSLLKIALLRAYVDTVMSTINYSMMTYQQADMKNKSELSALIDQLFDYSDTMYKNISESNMQALFGNVTLQTETDEFQTISVSEYLDCYDTTDAIYDPQYQDLLNEFIVTLQIQYQNFLCTAEPQLLNSIVENIYIDSTNYSIDSDEFTEGLKNYKNDFADFILGRYEHSDEYIKDQSNIPVDIWFNENTTTYAQSLLLLSYGNQDDISINMHVFSSGYHENGFNNYDNGVFKNREAFQLLKNTHEWFNKDFTNYKINDIAKDYETLVEGLNHVLQNSRIGVSNIIKNTEGKLQFLDSRDSYWLSTLEEMGYVNFENGKYSLVCGDLKYESNNPDDIITVSNDLLIPYIRKTEGLEGIHRILQEHYDSISGYSDFNKYLSEVKSNGLFEKLNCSIAYESVLNFLQNSFIDFSNKKIALDVSRANYKMAMVKSIDTSMVTEEDISWARQKLGGDAKYLEDWQIKTYALLNRNDLNLSDDMLELYESDLNATYNNTIASGKGYDAAIEQLKKMTGEDRNHIFAYLNMAAVYANPGNVLLNYLVPDLIDYALDFVNSTSYSVTSGLYDGLSNSIKGVARIFTADGIMSVDDYRRSYLQELLGTDFRIYSDYYNTNNENHQHVVNMLSNNYDFTTLKDYKTIDGINIFDEAYIQKAKERNLCLFEILYENKLIDNDEYLRYYNLNNRKDDGNIAFYASMGDNLVLKDINKWTYNIGSGVGNMVIPMLLSSFVSPAAMSAWLFLSVTGNEREALLVSGKENNVGTYLQATSKGLVAVLTERFLGSLKGYGARADDILNVFSMDNALMTKFMATGFGQTFARVLSSQVHETFEELVENVGDHLIDFIADGTIPDSDDLWKETWMTALTTFATTPLINLMGEGMQGNKYSYGNRLQTHNLNGVEVSYSPNELAQFTKDGILDYKGFMEYLWESGRFGYTNQNQENTFIDMSQRNVDTFIPERVLETKNSVVESKNSPYNLFANELGVMHTNEDSTYRQTGISQISDIIDTGYVRANSAYDNNEAKKNRIWWTQGSNKLHYKPDPRAILEISSDKISEGQIGAVSLDDLSHIWVYDDEQSKYVDVIDKVKELRNNKKTSGLSLTFAELNDKLNIKSNGNKSRQMAINTYLKAHPQMSNDEVETLIDKRVSKTSYDRQARAYAEEYEKMNNQSSKVEKAKVRVASPQLLNEVLRDGWYFYPASSFDAYLNEDVYNATGLRNIKTNEDALKAFYSENR